MNPRYSTRIPGLIFFSMETFGIVLCYFFVLLNIFDNISTLGINSAEII